MLSSDDAMVTGISFSGKQFPFIFYGLRNGVVLYFFRILELDGLNFELKLYHW